MNYLFVGPSGALPPGNLTVERARSAGWVIKQPIEHGDLLRLNLLTGDLVVIADGLFHHVAPIRHKELVEVVARGIRVIGCSSMGALRASELHTLGVEGVGIVYEWYRDGVIVADDEVALLHAEAEENYKPLTVPLVSLRHAAQQVASRGPSAWLTDLQDAARALHYTERSWRALRGALPVEAHGVLREVEAAVARADVKGVDLVTAMSYVAHLPRRAATPPVVRSIHLARWQLQCTRAPGTANSEGEVLQALQLWDRGFPILYRSYVLEAIASEGPYGGDLASRCLAAAFSRGLILDDGTPTRPLRALMGDASSYSEEDILTALVRTYRKFPGDRTIDRLEDLNLTHSALNEGARLASTAIKLGDRLRTERGLEAQAIPDSMVLSLLSRLWATRDVALAAADRGFNSHADVLRAGRCHAALLAAELRVA